MVEVVADEIGPSLRWATAQVDRNDRREGGGTGGPARPGGEPGRRRPPAAAAQPTYDDNAGEEPF